jgi:BMFP domain-containing protein YqiC
MQSQNKLFDDFVKVMNGAAGTLAGMTREAQAAMQERARDWIGGLDMVSREEFETVKALAVAAREENAALRARIEALEAASAGAGAGAAAAAAQASATRPRRKPGASEGAV